MMPEVQYTFKSRRLQRNFRINPVHLDQKGLKKVLLYLHLRETSVRPIVVNNADLEAGAAYVMTSDT